VKFYAGIGSRETPRDVLRGMAGIAGRLGAKSYILRSGGADGADGAFEIGASTYGKEIYLPWAGFNGRMHSETFVAGDSVWMQGIARQHHPRWSSLSGAAKKLHTRNVAQILGNVQGGPISEFVICWTLDGKGEGGTGQAIRIARAYGVPVYDLALPDTHAKVRELVS
jgi:hypothetical protein